MSLRPVKGIMKASRAMDGAGVDLHRVFGQGTVEDTDPFLMLDDFRNENIHKKSPGFPWHPHRGIETITYILSGGVEHQDSLGNHGVLNGGDIQWMTAGSGIIHQEMPLESGYFGHGFQLWANLPSDKKMTDPRYQDVPSAEIPEVTEDDGTRVRVITGDFWGKTGPVTGIATNPRYLDVTVPPDTFRKLILPLDQNAFAYVFEGSGRFLSASQPFPVPTEYVTAGGIHEAVPAHPVENRNLVLFDSGDEIALQSGPEGMRFLLISGKPLKEPVAWHGPIVMNTREELVQAFHEYENGSFIKKGQSE